MQCVTSCLYPSLSYLSFVPGQVSLNASSVVCYVQQPYPLGWSQLQLQWLCMSFSKCFTSCRTAMLLYMYPTAFQAQPPCIYTQASLRSAGQQQLQSQLEQHYLELWFSFCVCFYQLLNALFCLLCVHVHVVVNTSLVLPSLFQLCRIQSDILRRLIHAVLTTNITQSLGAMLSAVVFSRQLASTHYCSMIKTTCS